MPAKSVNSIKNPSLHIRAELIKAAHKKKMDVEAFLRSSKAIEEARKQVSIILNKAKAAMKLLEDDSSGLTFGYQEENDRLFAFGYNRKYVCFNWRRPHAYEINEAMLRVALYEQSGVWEFDEEHDIYEMIDYKYTRNPNGIDGWVHFDSGEDFISTDDLVEQWIDAFLVYSGLQK